jgi:hypothetical protein
MTFTFPVPPLTNPFVFRASAALAGAGAWDATPLVIACPQHSRVTFYMSYTRGAAGGAVDFQLLVSPYSATVAGVENWFIQTEFSPAVLAAGVDSQSRLQQEYVTYASKAAAIENVVYGPVDIGANVERIELRARESGVVGTPGTFHVMGVVYSEQ